MNGFLLSDESRNVYTFRGIALGAGESLTVYVGCGQDGANAVYWCSDTPVWNNSGDTAYLADAQGKYIDQYIIESQ